MIPLFLDSLARFKHRKTVYMFGVMTILAVLIAFASSNLSIPAQAEGGIDSYSLRDLDNFAGNMILKTYQVFLMIMQILAVFLAAGAVPGMLGGGASVYYLSKPVSRVNLISGKLLSEFVIYGAVVAITGFIVLLALTGQHGFYGLSIFWLFAGILVSLALWIPIVALVGVWSNSTTNAMLAAFIIWLLQFGLSATGTDATSLLGESLLGWLALIFYYVLPKFSQINDLFVELAAGRTVADWMPLWSSILFSAICMWGCLELFKKKEY